MRRSAPSRTRPELMFRGLARYYDLLASHKDYRAEAASLAAIVRKYGRGQGRTWLDVACGTGRHLEYLQEKYSVVGVDLSREMLAIARRRLPAVELHRGDMRTFRLRRRFDVVSCLFSAIGHLPSERALGHTLANFAQHLNPGGVVVVEPWIRPDKFREGSVHLVTGQTPELAVARLAYSQRRGNLSRIEYHYVVARQGKGIRHFEETNIGLLVAPARLVSLMRGAGLHARFLTKGLPSGRGLVIGVRPGAVRTR